MTCVMNGWQDSLWLARLVFSFPFYYYYYYFFALLKPASLKWD